ncbi:MAG: hypothetical protein H6729_01990 [Deltaproteobacteria bacterium]|nr:hypothetical protein [Deltaproteobacteria bacterium]
MYIRRDLGWLEGYPNGPRSGSSLTWAYGGLGAALSTVILDRHLLSRSTRTLNMLLREFPEALPRLVGDVEEWAESRRALIRALKPVVHGTKTLSDVRMSAHSTHRMSSTLPIDLRRAEALVAKHGALLEACAAFQWAYWARPECLGPAFSWLERHAACVSHLQKYLADDHVAVCIRLFQMELELGARRVQPLVDFFRQRGIWEVPLEISVELPNHVEKLLSTEPSDIKCVEIPDATLGPRIARWCLWLAAQDQTVRRSGVDTFVLLAGRPAIEDWQAWWATFTKEIEADARIQKPTRRKDPNRQLRIAARDRAKKRLASLPPALPARELERLLRTLPEQPNHKILGLLRSQAEIWPETLFGANTRLALARHWFRLWRDREEKETKKPLFALIRSFTAYAKDVRYTEERLTPWRSIWTSLQKSEGSPHGMIDDDVMWVLKDPKKLDIFWRHLRVLAQVGQPHNTCVTEAPGTSIRAATKNAELLVGVCAAFSDEEVQFAYKALVASPAIKDYVPHRALRSAAAFMPVPAAQLVEFVTRFKDAHGQYDGADTAFRKMASIFRAAGASDAFLDGLKRGGVESFLRTAMKVRFIESQRSSIPAIKFQDISETPGWLGRYPPAIQTAIRYLLRCDIDARQTAQRILKKDFPDRAQLEEEIARLEKKATNAGKKDDERCQRRLENLKARIHEDAIVSDSRAERLRRQICQAAHAKLFSSWLFALDEEVSSSVARWIEVDGRTDWMADDRLIRAITPVFDLAPHVQALARRILAARAEDHPWALRGAAANQRFLEKMKRAGLDLSPWLDGFRHEAETKDAVRLTVTFEDDPLEICLMGHYFNTCLSPGAANYFSVFANIADVNKRVVYARDRKGRVHGRVLLGLTDEGGILVFHPYAHSEHTGFPTICKRFVETLATRMRTIVVPSGRLSTLVAKDWYDDGPCDLASRHTALEDGSPFRTELETVLPEDFFELARVALAPLPLNELTLPLLVALPEVVRRGELVLELLPIARRTNLPLHAITRIVQTLVDSGLAHGSSCDPGPGPGHGPGHSPRPGPGGEQTASESLADWVYRQALLDTPPGRVPWDAAELLHHLDPARSVRLLTKTRSRGVRRWDHEPDGFRLMLLGQAYERLHRANKAIGAYQRALSGHLDKQSGSFCVSAIERLRTVVKTPKMANAANTAKNRPSS